MAEALSRAGQAGGIDALDAALPVATGLRVVRCHFKRINDCLPFAVTCVEGER